MTTPWIPHAGKTLIRVTSSWFRPVREKVGYVVRWLPQITTNLGPIIRPLKPPGGAGARCLQILLGQSSAVWVPSVRRHANPDTVRTSTPARICGYHIKQPSPVLRIRPPHANLTAPTSPFSGTVRAPAQLIHGEGDPLGGTRHPNYRFLIHAHLVLCQETVKTLKHERKTLRPRPKHIVHSHGGGWREI